MQLMWITFWANYASWMQYIAISALVLGLNLLARAIFRLSLSAGADWVLLLWVVDLGVMQNITKSLPHNVEEYANQGLINSLIFLIICGVAFWVACLGTEIRIDKINHEKTKTYGKPKLRFNTIGLAIVALTIATIDTMLHFNTYKPF